MEENLIDKAINLANSKNKMLIINIPEGLSEAVLQDLREFIKSLSRPDANTNVRIINKTASKDMRLFIDKDILQKLYQKIGEDNVTYR